MGIVARIRVGVVQRKMCFLPNLAVIFSPGKTPRNDFLYFHV